jgi:hypothetical protein
VSDAANFDATKRDSGAFTQTGGCAEVGIDDGTVRTTQVHQRRAQDDDGRYDKQTQSK